MKRRFSLGSLLLALALATAMGCGEETPSNTGAASGVPGLTPKFSEEQIKKARAPLENRPAMIFPALTSLPMDREWTVQQTAADALARIGGSAVPALIATLHDPEPHARAQAAQALARMGPAAKPAVPALIEALSDPDDSVRQSAARALGQIGPDAEDAVPALIELLREPEPSDQNPDADRAA